MVNSPKQMKQKSANDAFFNVNQFTYGYKSSGNHLRPRTGEFGKQTVSNWRHTYLS
eukprot:m.251290 g.251290  ORF g.251290 m.251290 type:complete len:56 (-) comp15900_c0_seq2:2-169(-)